MGAGSHLALLPLGSHQLRIPRGNSGQGEEKHCSGFSCPVLKYHICFLIQEPSQCLIFWALLFISKTEAGWTKVLDVQSE